MEKQNIGLKVVVKIAEKVGRKSVDAACVWWVYQPKVPDSMLKKGKEDD